MILDFHRLRLEIQSKSVSDNIRDTINHLLEEHDGHQIEKTEWDTQCAEQQAEIERLKKQIADAIKMVESLPPALPPPPVTRVVADEKILTSKFAGNCTECGGAYTVGDKIRWTPGIKGAKHIPENCV